MKTTRPFFLALASLICLAGCDPFTLTALGVGAGAGVSHTMNGYTYRTFSEPLPRVKRATLVALNKMAIKVESTEKTDKGETIHGRTADRSIEVELDVISANATRIRSVAKKNILMMDQATAAEVISQTQRALGV